MSEPLEAANALGRGVILTCLLFVVYMGFIGLVAFAPGLMAWPAIGVLSFGLVAAVAVIVFAVLVTAFYVWRGNAEDRS